MKVLFMSQVPIRGKINILSQEDIRKAVRPVAEKHNLDEVFLFGSYARGDSTRNSDCDLRVVGGDFPGMLELAGLYLDLKEALGKEVDVVTNEDITETFYDLIKDEEIQIYAKM